MTARKSVASPAGSAAGRIRIIGGQWKRTPIVVPASPGLRPTPDRVRETLFNWLGQRLDGLSVLDLFAGTGALGLEAASRGARRVVMIEKRRDAVASIARTIERLRATQIELIAADAFATVRRLADAGARFDLVFLDPPFGEELLEPAIGLLPAVLAPGARVHVETGAPFAAPHGWRIDRAGRAGQVRYHLMSREDDGGGESAIRPVGDGPHHDGNGDSPGEAA